MICPPPWNCGLSGRLLRCRWLDAKCRRAWTTVPPVVLRNVSAKATRAYWFRVRIVCADPFNKAASTPPAGDGGPAVTGQDRRWPNESIIAPGAEGEAHVAGLNGYQLAFFRRERRL